MQITLILVKLIAVNYKKSEITLNQIVNGLHLFGAFQQVRSTAKWLVR